MVRKTKGKVRRVIDWGIKGIGQINFHGLYDDRRDYEGFKLISGHKRRIWKGNRHVKIDIKIGFKEIALTVGTVFALGLLYNKFIASSPSSGAAFQRIEKLERGLGRFAKEHDAFAHTISKVAKENSLRADQVEKIVAPMLQAKEGVAYLRRVHSIVVRKK